MAAGGGVVTHAKPCSPQQSVASCVHGTTSERPLEELCLPCLAKINLHRMNLYLHSGAIMTVVDLECE